MQGEQQTFSMMDTIPPMHPEGRKFVLGACAVAFVFILLGSAGLFWLAILIAIFCAFFFRDPVRVVPQIEGAVISPADGRIQAIVDVPPPPELDMGKAPLTRISIFLSVFDVHVNRAPATGRIDKRVYVPGAFVNASLDKASTDNERMLLRMRMADGRAVAFVQIAGLVARRIVCHVEEGDELEAGERFGIIRFGSRMDVYLPAGMTPTVAIGQRAVGGETVIAAAGAAVASVRGVSR